MTESGQTQSVEVYLVPVCPSEDTDTATLMVGVKLAGFIVGSERPVTAWYYGAQTTSYAKPVRQAANQQLRTRQIGGRRASDAVASEVRCNSYGLGRNSTQPEQSWTDFLAHCAACETAGGSLVIIGDLRRLSLLAESGLHGELRMVGNLQGGPLRQGADDRPDGDIWRGTFSTETSRWVEPPVRLYSRH